MKELRKIKIGILHNLEECDGKVQHWKPDPILLTQAEH